MRQLRFIFIAFLTSLFVTNAALLQKTQGGKADAVNPEGNTKGQAAASQSNDSIAGKWSSDWGPVEFNSNLTGQWNQGAGIGQIKDGTYDPKTRKLVFHYYQPWNDMNGTATLTLSEDGGQLSGGWTQQRGSNPPGSGGSGGWTMKRATPVTTPKGSTNRPAAASQSNDSIAGKWLSDWGPVEFNSNLTGQWNQGVGIGQIKDGTYDPKTRKLVFHYYQPWNNMDGTTTLTLSEDGQQLSGLWTQQRGSNPTGSGGSGGWTMKRAAPTFTSTRKVSQFALTRATTTDAKSVTVDYTVEATNSGESSEPIHFEIYRSSTEDADHAKEKIGQQDIKIGENDIPNSTRSSPDKHKVQLNLSVDSLMPNTAAPYVVVVATYNGKKSTTYFRKWMLGAISHGFNRYNQAGVLWPTAREIGWLYSGDAFTPREDPGGLPLWETNMAKSLKKYNKYDDVISFDWTKTCGLAQPDMAVQAGANLSKQITQWILAHRQHDGDVVDIHLIGHSRGTVVVTQALQHLSTASPSFEGGYIELTLLDPHPANNTLQKPWADFGRLANLVSDRLVSGDNGKAAQIIGYIADVKGITQDFQSEARDPVLNIPSGVKKADVWYQHTEAACLTDAPDQEYIMNLWGLENTVIPNNNGMGIVMDFQDLTSNNKQHHCNQPAVGHNQVPDVYERSVVETGTLNRSN